MIICGSIAKKLLSLSLTIIFSFLALPFVSEATTPSADIHFVIQDAYGDNQSDQMVIYAANQETIAKLEDLKSKRQYMWIGGNAVDGSSAFEPRYTWHWEKDSVFVSPITAEWMQTWIRYVEDPGWRGPNAFWATVLSSSFSPPSLQDTEAPQTYILSGPNQISSTNILAFTFWGNDDSSEPLLYASWLERKKGFPQDPPNSPWNFHSSTIKSYENITDAEYAFSVRAKDSSFWVDRTPASRTILVDTTPPSTRITNPSEGFVSGRVPINAEATDGGSGVSKVEFRIDGNLKNTDYLAPYTHEWSATQELAKDHKIEVTAFDKAGNTSMATVVASIKASIIYPIAYDLGNNQQPLSGIVTIKTSAYPGLAVSNVSLYATSMRTGQKYYIGKGSKTLPDLWSTKWKTYLLPDGQYKVGANVKFSDDLCETSPVTYSIQNTNSATK